MHVESVRSHGLLRFACLSLVLLAGASFGADEPVDESDQLGRLRHYLENVDALHASFRQEVFDHDLQLLEAATGEVTLKKPGRFRWHYIEPYERVIVADGQRVWLYEADLSQVTVRTLDASLGATPAALLTGDVAALEHFEYVGTEIDGTTEWIQLRPRAAESDFESIILGFGADELVEIALLDRLGQRTRIYLTDIERSIDPGDDIFQFVVPEGVDVIGEKEL
jgi:outer membrane lipoprotein carrier protein